MCYHMTIKMCGGVVQVKWYLQVVFCVVGHNAGWELISIHMGLDPRVLLPWKWNASGLIGQRRSANVISSAAIISG